MSISSNFMIHLAPSLFGDEPLVDVKTNLVNVREAAGQEVYALNITADGRGFASLFMTPEQLHSLLASLQADLHELLGE